MSRRKTAAELANDVRYLEERLARAKEKQRLESKAEEARQNAAIIKAVREGWDAMSPGQRPSWGRMAEYVKLMFAMTEEKQEKNEQAD